MINDGCAFVCLYNFHFLFDSSGQHLPTDMDLLLVFLSVSYCLLPGLEDGRHLLSPNGLNCSQCQVSLTYRDCGVVRVKLLGHQVAVKCM